MRLICGFCGHPTAEALCESCRHDPILPYLQRGQEPVVAEGRLDAIDIRRRLAEARFALGPAATTEELAERLDVSARTVRRWLELVR